MAVWKVVIPEPHEDHHFIIYEPISDFTTVNSLNAAK